MKLLLNFFLSFSLVLFGAVPNGSAHLAGDNSVPALQASRAGVVHRVVLPPAPETAFFSIYPGTEDEDGALFAPEAEDEDEASSKKKGSASFIAGFYTSVAGYFDSYRTKLSSSHTFHSHPRFCRYILFQVFRI